MANEFDWNQFEVIDDGQQSQFDWGDYQSATPSPSQAFIEAIQGALPAAGHMIAGAGRGFYDLIGGNDQEYEPKRALQSMVAGLLSGGRDLANTPGNIVDYLKDHGAPSWLQAWRPSQAVQDFDYRDFVGLEGTRPGDELIEGIARTIPATGLAMGAPGVTPGLGAYGGIGLSAIGQNENPLTAMAGAGILHGGGKIAGKVAGKGVGALENAILERETPGEMVAPKTQATNWLTKEKAGREVGDFATALKEELSGGYEQLKTDIRNAGIKGQTQEMVTKTIESDIIDPTTGKPITQTVTKLETPSLKEVSEKLKGVDESVQESVHRALESGDIGALIDAEKDLGKFKNNQYQDYWNTQKPLDRNAIHRATQMENKMNKIIEEMSAKLDPTQANRLLELRNRWKTELAPFLEMEAIERYTKGEITGADLTRRLQANTKQGELFRATLGKEFKNIGRNKFKNKLLSMGIKGGILGTIMKVAGG